jgi:cobalt/nickel transport system permease protein
MTTPAPSFLHRLPAGLKLLLALVIILTVSLLKVHRAPWLAVPAAILVLAVLLARLPLRPLLKRLLLLEPFVLGVALLALFAPATAGDGGGGRWLNFAFLVARCTLALLAMVLFTATTPFAAILRLFQRLHVPQLLVTTLALMHRYLFVLADETARMRRARQSRTFVGGKGRRWHTASTIVAQLFLRASDRADHIYDAMRARGWHADE